MAFINIFQGKALRGAETFVDEITKKLGKDIKADIISGEKALPTRWPILWRTFLDPQGLSILFYTLSLVPRLWREKYDVIVPVNGGFMPAVVRIITWLYRGKMVISGQSGMGWDERNNLWCFPDTFVALSGSALKWAKRVNPFVKSVYIPNGVDTKIFTRDGKKIKIDLKSPIVLCVGALTPAKRIDLTIRAVAKMKNASLLLTGSPGESEKELIGLGKKLLGNRFLYKLFLHKEMPDVYRTADVFTLVSLPYFSFEIAVIEAMSAGLPVVVNGDPIRKEIVGDFGFFVDPTDIDSYKISLILALKKGKSADFVNTARKYDWGVIGEKYKSVFEDVCKIK